MGCQSSKGVEILSCQTTSRFEKDAKAAADETYADVVPGFDMSDKIAVLQASASTSTMASTADRHGETTPEHIRECSEAGEVEAETTDDLISCDWKNVNGSPLMESPEQKKAGEVEAETTDDLISCDWKNVNGSPLMESPEQKKVNDPEWEDDPFDDSANRSHLRMESDDGAGNMHTFGDVQQLIFQGILQGFTDVTVADIAGGCKEQHAAVTIAYFKAAVGRFEEGTLSSSLKAMEEIANGLEVLRLAMVAAEVPELQVERLSDAMDQMRTTGDVHFFRGHEFAVNDKDMHGIVESSVQAFYSFEWVSFGMNIGIMVNRLASKKRSKEACACWQPF